MLARRRDEGALELLGVLGQLVHVDDVRGRPQLVQQVEQPAALHPLGEGVEEEHRDPREHDVVDQRLDQRQHVERARDLAVVVDDRVLGGQDQGDQRPAQDQQHHHARGDARDPHPALRRVRARLDGVDQQREVGGDLSQAALGEAGRDPGLELHDDVADGVRVEWLLHRDVHARTLRRAGPEDLRLWLVDSSPRSHSGMDVTTRPADLSAVREERLVVPDGIDLALQELGTGRLRRDGQRTRWLAAGVGPVPEPIRAGAPGGGLRLPGPLPVRPTIGPRRGHYPRPRRRPARRAALDRRRAGRGHRLEHGCPGGSRGGARRAGPRGRPGAGCGCAGRSAGRRVPPPTQPRPDPARDPRCGGGRRPVRSRGSSTRRDPGWAAAPPSARGARAHGGPGHLPRPGREVRPPRLAPLHAHRPGHGTARRVARGWAR